MTAECLCLERNKKTQDIADRGSPGQWIDRSGFIVMCGKQKR